MVTADLGSLDSVEPLRTIASQIRAEIGAEAVVIAHANVSDKPAILIATGEAARGRGVKAGALVKLASGILGGGGGGKDDMAQGGGTDFNAVPSALEAIEKELA